MSGIGVCREPKCRAKIRWCVVDNTVRTIPVDWEPTDNGNVVLTSRHLGDGRQICHVYANAEAAKAALAMAGDGDKPRYLAHFVTCAAPSRFRRNPKEKT